MKQISDHLRTASKASSNFLITVLLAAILVTQLLILFKLPSPAPTIGAIRNAATDEQRRKLIHETPIIHVQGGTVDVDVTNTPLQVMVER